MRPPLCVRASKSSYARWQCLDCKEGRNNTRRLGDLVREAREHADASNHKTYIRTETRIDFERRLAHGPKGAL